MSGTPQEVRPLPIGTDLLQNYPNPFNLVTRIEFDLLHTGMVELSVFDITGRRVADLIHEPLSAGHHTADFDAARLPSGVYLRRLHTNESVQTKKMMVVEVVPFDNRFVLEFS